MRKPLIAALLLLSCDSTRGTEIPAREALAAGAPNGVDLLVLRVPRNGGRGRVFSYPKLDSTVWTSSGSVPSISRVLSFDSEAGSLLFSDSRGVARSLDFRLNAVSPTTQLRLTNLTTADAWHVYGIAQNGTVGRSTPSAIFGGAPPAPWSFKPSLPVREVFPLANGSLLVVGADDTATIIWRLFPPESEATDSVVLERSEAAFRTPTGDRIYLSRDRGVTGISSRDLARAVDLRVGGGISEIVSTPSGNQQFVVGDSSNRVYIIDRYRGRVAGTIRFPRPVSAVRMDPLGRFLLARGFTGDTAWVVVLSNHRSVRVVETLWRTDLPAVAWDGSIVVVRGRDVAVLDPVTLETTRNVRNGAADYWHFFTWNGFRQRTLGDPEPVNFPVFVDHNEFESPRRRQVDIDDSIRAAAREAFRRDSIARADSVRSRLPARGIFTVSFAVLRSDSAASRLARSIRVRGQTARVVPAFVDATPIFRVVLGPYNSRAEAEAVGRASRVSFWVYEGPP